MSLKVDFEFVFAGRDENSFLENYTSDLEEFGERGGSLYLSAEIQNNPVDAAEIGAAMFDTMQTVFYEEITRDPYERFEVALKEVNNVLKEFRSRKSSGYIGNLNVIIAAIVGEELHLAQCGDSEAYLIRKRYVGVITEGLNEDNAHGDTFTSIASGTVEPGDFVLFSTARLLRYISKSDLAQTVSGGSIHAVLDSIKDTISTEILGRISLCGLTVSSVLPGMAFEEDEALGEVSSMPVRREHAAVAKIRGVFRTVREKVPFMKAASLRNLAPIGRNKVLIMLVGLIVVLFVGIGVVQNRSEARAEMERLEVILDGVQSKIAEAETKASYDKDSAAQILDQAQSESMQVLNSGYFREKAKLQLIQIAEVRDTIDNVQRITSPVVYADLAAKRSDVSALGFAILSDRVFAFEYNALYELVLDQVQEPLTIDADETVVAATGFEDRESVVFLTKSGALIEYRGGIMSVMDTEDKSFHKGNAITSWSNRIYILDDIAGRVWRYTYKGTRDSFSVAESYLSEEEKIEQGRDLAIDSNVYVLQANGEILKFYSGTKVNFFINDMPMSSFEDPVALYTTDSLSEVLVLDGAAKRVFVFAKEGKSGNLRYTTQYLLEGTDDLRDVYMDKEGDVFVLSASKVYKIDR